MTKELNLEKSLLHIYHLYDDISWCMHIHIYIMYIYMYIHIYIYVVIYIHNQLATISVEYD